ncbi:GTP cyclohydrolase II [Halomonas heilongjiangensis]|uniref:GTP cyclohydrolase-2 n=1 Tax=Halomonas heilongjiangensis TaxID=1387883 RepID=A0A2N7TFM7_9GAMM|nr:GTP cyclohydrolase II [Halomonas heilongjiangensis]PMR66978.1 GTP cyclohydrolase [Halomonas heilongjiangensis]PXX88106.1 GTP cyclohydrolase [Halomonas heilongjiangensis]
MHQVERAIFDLRRGLPVLLLAGEARVLVQAIEGAAEAAVARLAEEAGSTPALVLSRHRLAQLGETEAATPSRLPLPEWTDRQRLAELAFGARPEERLGSDDLARWRRALEPAESADRGALALMRRALLIPAALVARVADPRRRAVEALVAEGTLLAVEAAPAERCLEGGLGMLKRVSEAHVPLADAFDCRFVLFREPDGLREHVAVVIGEPEIGEVVPLRLHSACLTGDLFGSLRCDCGEQLRNAVTEIEALGGGVLLYLAQEGRGIGLANKLRAYTLQDSGLDTLDADRILGFGDDERHYGVAVDMLASLGIRRVQLLTNNPRKVAALTEGGIEVVARQALYGSLNDHNRRYLSAKAERAGHLLDGVLNGHEDGPRRS